MADPGAPPRIAVVIPCHDDGELAVEAAHSIREEEPVEVVVVDDGSGDGPTLTALEALRREGIRVVRHGRNRGLAAARTTGMRETSAPYVFPLDADDLAVPGVLAAMADRLDADPGAAACFGDYAEFGARVAIRPVTHWLDPYRVAYHNEWPPSALFRRSALDAVGGWTLDAAGYEDWDLWMTLAERGYRAVHLGTGTVTYRRRLHAGRMQAAARREHGRLYRELRRRHPALFAARRANRSHSDLRAAYRVLYPAVYGGRPRVPFEPQIRDWLARLRLWRLRR